MIFPLIQRVCVSPIPAPPVSARDARERFWPGWSGRPANSGLSGRRNVGLESELSIRPRGSERLLRRRIRSLDDAR
jgi:hypothetical protein